MIFEVDKTHKTIGKENMNGNLIENNKRNARNKK